MFRKSRLILFLAMASPFLWAAGAHAQGWAHGGERIGGFGGQGPVIVVGGGLHGRSRGPSSRDPVWGAYPYKSADTRVPAKVRVRATPKDAKVCVDRRTEGGGLSHDPHQADSDADRFQ
jgi:hypothetical protein